VQTDISPLKRAILEALAYSDIFEHPLTMEEIHRFLGIPASLKDVHDCLLNMEVVSHKQGYYFLDGHEDILEIRLVRRQKSWNAYNRAMLYGRILGYLPFIRMVALTGSLAMLNLSKNRDIDYMLVARSGRVWTARAFVLLFGRIAKFFGDEICPNVIVSENALQWNARNIYTAREFAQMIPVIGVDIFHRLLDANRWLEEILPNIEWKNPSTEGSHGLIWQKFIELFLNGKAVDRFEAWEMNRKIVRFTKQKGFGIETNFNADICQGNFDHHGSWALNAYEERLKSLGVLGNST